MGLLGGEFVFGMGGSDEGLSFATPSTVDHIAAATDRLAYQFKDKPNINQIITELCHQVNDLEIVLGSQMPLMPVIASSVGAQLDTIGALIGEPRGGFGDTDYRTHLTARIYLNKSSGRADDIYSLFAALLGISSGLWIEEHPPAAFTVHVTGAILDQTLADYLTSILQRAKAAGINAKVNWNTVAVGAAFSFAGGPGLGFEAGIWSTTE